MNRYRFLQTGLAASALALVAFPAASPAQSECEQIRRECADYCRYGPVDPFGGRDCKEKCRKQVQDCQRGLRAAEGYPTYGAPGGYGGGYAPGYGYGAPGYGAPYGGIPYGGAPYGGVPYYGGYAGSPPASAPAGGSTRRPTGRAPE